MIMIITIQITQVISNNDKSIAVMCRTVITVVLVNNSNRAETGCGGDNNDNERNNNNA